LSKAQPLLASVGAQKMKVLGFGRGIEAVANGFAINGDEFGAEIVALILRKVSLLGMP